MNYTEFLENKKVRLQDSGFEVETVFSPFAGIGSEIYQAIKLNRKGIGIELKESYFNQAVRNCKLAEQEINLPTLFAS